jgi:DNA polymerase-3 subunit gamma/tau
MSHRVFSLKYRPQNFDELTGQRHVVLSLKGAIKSGRVGHAFLFAGPRGIGKTTTARILAKSLNCITGPTVTPCQQCQFCREITLTRSVDVVEIDGASNRGIEEIRNLRDGVKYSPLHSRYKIYIIDEVHMLTQEAFNALLKTLEEPPPQVVFVFATTNPTKVPATILSRCQRFMFKRLSLQEITERMRMITEKENIAITDQALHYLAIRADGSIRDGESILEQLTSFVDGEITEEDVFKLIGFLGNDFYFDFLRKIAAHDFKKTIICLNKGIEEGADPLEIYRGLTNHLRLMLLIKSGMSEEFLELNGDEIELLQNIQLSAHQIISLLAICLQSEEMIKRSVNVRIAIELLLSQLILSIGEPEVQNPDTNTHNATSQQTKDAKMLLSAALEKNNPKLAAIIHKASIEQDNNTITISVLNEFSQRELLNNKDLLESILNTALSGTYQVTVQLEQPSKKGNSLIDTIKVMFDGEEVR